MLAEHVLGAAYGCVSCGARPQTSRMGVFIESDGNSIFDAFIIGRAACKQCHRVS